MAASNRPADTDRRDGPSPQQPLSELISRMTSDLGALVRHEIELAKIEIKDDVRHTARAGGMFAGAGFAGYMTVVLATLALVFALDLGLPLWSAFLIVGAVYGIVAFILFQQARVRMKQFTPGPEQTVETLKEDVEWAKTRKR